MLGLIALASQRLCIFFAVCRLILKHNVTVMCTVRTPAVHTWRHEPVQNKSLKPVNCDMDVRNPPILLSHTAVE